MLPCTHIEVQMYVITICSENVYIMFCCLTKSFRCLSKLSYYICCHYLATNICRFETACRIYFFFFCIRLTLLFLNFEETNFNVIKPILIPTNKFVTNYFKTFTQHVTTKASNTFVYSLFC